MTCNLVETILQLENYQTADGIKIPQVLIPYTGFDIIN